jgi:MerR family transcriptional regulator, copper efflux regulator
MCPMPIGELSRRTDTPVATIRYYEDIGMLPAADRSPAGRRVYGQEDVARLDFIRARRALGFALKDIATALHPGTDCAPSLDQARNHLARVTRQIDRLQAVAADLRAQIATCATDCTTGIQPTCLIVPA